MNLAPRKLGRAHALLVDLLVGGPQLVASCVTWARERTSSAADGLTLRHASIPPAQPYQDRRGRDRKGCQARRWFA